jgi:hypothetical protein
VLGAGGKDRHADLVRELDIPVPFDLGEFVAGLERQRHRPIRLCPQGALDSPGRERQVILDEAQPATRRYRAAPRITSVHVFPAKHPS